MNEAEKLDKILEIVQEIQQADAKRDALLEQIRCDVGDHEKDINGNGKPGLKTDVAVLQEQVTRLVWMLGAVGVAFLGSIITLAVAILTHQLKVGP